MNINKNMIAAILAVYFVNIINSYSPPITLSKISLPDLLQNITLYVYGYPVSLSQSVIDEINTELGVSNSTNIILGIEFKADAHYSGGPFSGGFKFSNMDLDFFLAINSINDKVINQMFRVKTNTTKDYATSVYLTYQVNNQAYTIYNYDKWEDKFNPVTVDINIIIPLQATSTFKTKSLLYSSIDDAFQKNASILSNTKVFTPEQLYFSYNNNTPLLLAIQLYSQNNGSNKNTLFANILNLYMNDTKIWSMANKSGDTPFLAMVRNNFDIVYLQSAIKAGGVAMLDQQNTQDGNNPLFLAINNYIARTDANKDAWFASLLNLYATDTKVWSMTNKSGDTPLLAMVRNNFNSSYFKSAITAGGYTLLVQPNKQDGDTFLTLFIKMYVARVPVHTDENPHFSYMLNLCFDNKNAAVWNAKNSSGDSPLSLIIKNSLPISYLKQIIEKGNISWADMVAIVLPSISQMTNANQAVSHCGSTHFDNLSFTNSNKQSLTTTQNSTAFINYLNAQSKNQVLGIISKDRLSITLYYPDMAQKVQTVTYASNQPIASIAWNLSLAGMPIQMQSMLIVQTAPFFIIYKT